ncbi:ribonuclease III [Sphingomonas nostoxanthinifaciens]|uniref:ribonuclease III n=1 Tax=Sphingomonas nostoxanthinifaciens TaxID=2872652 RepID=UPI001CC1EE65|nr:ribonuclease III [Sphingomonas nostoxanthinifaciens]UAK26337.1 ribonuclease III [Sphingomonas nostoxanthinifaciens]
MTAPSDIAAWVATAFDHQPRDPKLFARALTHGSHGGGESYERLEFLGDRVLGLVVATWLYERFPTEPEGSLSARFNAIVSRESCAVVGRTIGVPAWLILGKQARDDGAQMSDNVVGDAVEALLGALYLEAGLDAATAFVRRAFDDRLDARSEAPKHPKSALQEWAAAHHCRPPVYSVVARSGPHHAPSFTIQVEVGGKAGGSATADGSSKQEAEKAAAAALLEKLA